MVGCTCRACLSLTARCLVKDDALVQLDEKSSEIKDKQEAPSESGRQEANVEAKLPAAAATDSASQSLSGPVIEAESKSSKKGKAKQAEDPVHQFYFNRGYGNVPVRPYYSEVSNHCISSC